MEALIGLSNPLNERHQSLSARHPRIRQSGLLKFFAVTRANRRQARLADRGHVGHAPARVDEPAPVYPVVFEVNLLLAERGLEEPEIAAWWLVRLATNGSRTRAEMWQGGECIEVERQAAHRQQVAASEA